MSKASLAPSPFAPTQFPVLPDVRGVKLRAGRLGLYPRERDDLIVAVCSPGTVAGGVFTQSLTASPDVLWCREALETGGGVARVLVCNAGNSNAGCGALGEQRTRAIVTEAASLAGCAATEVLVAATGVIGQPLPVRRIADGLAGHWPQADQTASSIEAAARAFMTTDTFPKGAGSTFMLDGKPCAIAAIAKGSGMIAPNMATMLTFAFTDAALAPDIAQKLVAHAAHISLNRITVDGDTSTSDTMILFATGAAGNAPITSDADPRYAIVANAVNAAFISLATQIVEDGEGASKFVRVVVSGAVTDASARKVAKVICESPLVKTALAASDANWGRVIAAVGRAGEPADVSRLSVHFGSLRAAVNGACAPDYDEAAMSTYLQGRRIEIFVDLGVGTGTDEMWTCDLTHGYVEINGAYRT